MLVLAKEAVDLSLDTTLLGLERAFVMPQE